MRMAVEHGDQADQPAVRGEGGDRTGREVWHADLLAVHEVDDLRRAERHAREEGAGDGGRVDRRPSALARMVRRAARDVRSSRQGLDLPGRRARRGTRAAVIVGIGTDAIDIARVERMLAKNEQRMMERLFTVDEASFLTTKTFPAQHMAVRLAAKEAAYKALSGNDLARGIGWREIEVFSQNDGSPRIRLHGRAAARFVELGATTIHVSLTHSQTTAVAVVIVER